MAHWAETMGIGPFFTVEPPQQDGALYRGRPAKSPAIRAALAHSGDLQIELVMPLTDEPSLFREVVSPGTIGLHHVAICSQNYDEDVAFYTRDGAQIALSATTPAGRICWVDTSHTMGFMVEIMTAGPATQWVFDKVRSAAENWDGRDPVRPLI